MIVREVVRDAASRDGVHHASLGIHALDRRLDESCSAQRGADGLRTMTQLECSRARLEEERREHEEVVAAHERDLDGLRATVQSLQLPCRGDAAEPTT